MLKVLTRRVSSSTFDGPPNTPLYWGRKTESDIIRDFLKQAETDGKKDAAGKEKAAH
jgi:hypothetical protein